MAETITAAEANRSFSRILREGRSYTVTSHGRPVARIIPADAEDQTADTAWAALLERLKNQPVREVEPWTRDELYEDET